MPRTPAQNICSKPIRELCWACWVEPFWINLLHSGAIYSNNWRRYFKLGQLYYKAGQVLQSVATLLQSGGGIIKWGNNYY